MQNKRDTASQSGSRFRSGRSKSFCQSAYRPVSLTSCMAKRSRQSTTWRKYVTGYAWNKGASVVTDHVKTRSYASRSRSMMDTRQKSPKKIVSALLNYSKAFGGMTCLPIAYAQWARDFPSNSKTKVQVNGDRGRQLPLRQGLP